MLNITWLFTKVYLSTLYIFFLILRLKFTRAFLLQKLLKENYKIIHTIFFIFYNKIYNTNDIIVRNLQFFRDLYRKKNFQSRNNFIFLFKLFSKESNKIPFMKIISPTIVALIYLHDHETTIVLYYRSYILSTFISISSFLFFFYI